MSDNYTQGTISVSTNSPLVTGQGTFFKSIGLVQAGSLFTLDGEKFYLIADVVSDTELLIEQMITRGPFAEASVTNASYTIVKNFARQTNTGLAADFVAFQNQLLEKQFDFYNWMLSDETTYTIDREGSPVVALTPKGIEQQLSSIQNKVKPTKNPKVETSIQIALKRKRFIETVGVEQPPTGKPNNNNLLVDPIRQDLYFPAGNEYLKMPKGIGNRNFCIMPRGTFLRLGSKYTGTVTMRVYPLEGGGGGLPNNPTLDNFKWQEFTTVVPEEGGIYKIGEDGGNYFTGIIDWIKLDGRWATLDVDKSHYPELNAYFDKHFGTLKSPMRNYTLHADGYWYSDDMMPDTPNSIGASWTKVSKRHFYVNGASDTNDALRLFSDAYDEYEFEILLNVHETGSRMAITNSNQSAFSVFDEGPHRFIVNRDRIFFKRGASHGPITGNFTIESVRMRIPYE